MKSDVRLGLRLARGGQRGDRLRGAATVLASLVGSWVMLTTLAIILAQIDQPGYSDGRPLLVLAVTATVGVPVVVLVATAARLSAALRDRRLAGLRLLGLSASRTRLVSAVETGAGAAVGSVLGLLAFVTTRPLLPDLHGSSRAWLPSTLAFSSIAAALVVSLPLVAAAVSLVPGAHLTPDQRQQAVARPTPQPPSPWRFAPLVIGLIMTLTSGTGAANGVAGGRFGVLIAGGVLCAIGIVAVVPVFTKLLADVMIRLPGRPSLRIAGRRLQAQPAGVSRIVAGLLVGLFVVSGGRMVVGTFEGTPQYRSAAQALTDGPATYTVILTDRDALDGAADALASVDGVRGSYVDRQIVSGCVDGGPCLAGFVGTCHDLKSAVPDAVGCRDDRVAWLDEVPDSAAQLGRTTRWESQSSPPATTALAPTPGRSDVITSKTSTYGTSDAMQAQVFIPSSTPGMTALADDGRGDILTRLAVQVDPHELAETQLREIVLAIDPGADIYPQFDVGEYNFVDDLRALVWGVAAAVLAIGLLGFVIATIDRTVSRRSEMVSLQLVGTPRGVIRSAQWWEAALPLLVGIALAIGAGSAVGYSYLAYGGSLDVSPWHSLLALVGVSIAAVVGIAGLTVIACAPRIRAELIRRV